jgi:phosphate transport system substrate-binding protein
MRTRGMLFAFLVVTATVAGADAVQNLSGVIRISGNPELKVLLDRWSAGFRKAHPDVRIETHLTGSDTGMAALYSSKADLALLGRSPTASEIQAFEWVFRYKPSQVEILTGSLGRSGRSPALALFVHRDNPLAGLTLAQPAAVFGAEHRVGATNIRTWGQLGLTGEWADKPISLYAPDSTSGTGRFFRHVVLDDSRMMNWAALTEFADTAPTGATHDAGRQIIAALARDRYGLAVASLDFANDTVKPVALGGVGAARDTLIARQYPLTRAVLACYNRASGASPDPLVAAFLRYILSAGGRQLVGPDDGYLPLTEALAATQAQTLN